jgi:hypothetical protein
MMQKRIPPPPISSTAELTMFHAAGPERVYIRKASARIKKPSRAIETKSATVWGDA